MSRDFIHIFVLMLCMAGLPGCSRTVDDVESWKARSNIEKLKKALKDPKMEVRAAAAQALGELDCKAAVDDLTACLNDAESDVFSAALDALIAIGDTSVSTPLIATLTREDAEVRLKAVRALESLRATAAVSGLAELLNDDSAEVQSAAIHALGQIGAESGVPPLIRMLNGADGPEELRLASIYALGKIGGEEASICLLKMLPSGNSGRMEAAQKALNQIGPVAIQCALESLGSKDEVLRFGALKHLKRSEAVPSEGDEFIWYRLALAAQSGAEEGSGERAAELASLGADAIPALIDAACHPNDVMREIACLALERIGFGCLDAVVERAKSAATDDAKKWFNSRKMWDGAPSDWLDLWGTISALNPNFPAAQVIKDNLSTSDLKVERAYVPLLIHQLGNKATAAGGASKVEGRRDCRVPAVDCGAGERE